MKSYVSASERRFGVARLSLRSSVVLLALAVISLPASAQTGSVRGRVVLAGAGTPVGGGTVSVVGTTRVIATAEDGSFQFIGLTPGNYEIEGRRIGTTIARTSVTVREDATTDVTLRVAEAPVE